MKKFFKGLIMVAATLSVVVSVHAQATIGGPLTGNALYAPVTALVVPGAVTTSAVAIANIQGAKYVGVQVVSKSGAANLSNTVVTIDRSIDGSNWVTGYTTITLANTGTTSANCISNYNPASDALWRFNVQNGSLAVVTNTVTITINRVP